MRRELVYKTVVYLVSLGSKVLDANAEPNIVMLLMKMERVLSAV